MRKALVNLLPPDALSGYIRHRRFTILTRLVVAIGSVFLVLNIFVGSSWFYLTTLERAEQQRLSTARGSAEHSRAEQLEKKLAELAAEVNVLRVLEQPQYDPADLVREIAAVMPRGVHLRAISITLAEPKKQQPAKTTEKKTGPTLFMSGQAETRGDVLAFERALKELPFVSAIEGPLENIIKPTDSPFSFDIQLKPPAEAFKEEARGVSSGGTAGAGGP